MPGLTFGPSVLGHIPVTDESEGPEAALLVREDAVTSLAPGGAGTANQTELTEEAANPLKNQECWEWREAAGWCWLQRQ